MPDLTAGAFVVFAALIGWLAGLSAATRGAAHGAKLAFENAVRLDQERQAVRDRALLRAVVGELNETLRLTYEMQSGRRLARLRRTAWERARHVPMPDQVFAAVSEAYVRGDIFNGQLENLFARSTDIHYDTRAEQNEVRRLAVEELRPLLHDAQYSLAIHLGLEAPWSDRPPHWPKQP